MLLLSSLTDVYLVASGISAKVVRKGGMGEEEVVLWLLPSPTLTHVSGKATAAISCDSKTGSLLLDDVSETWMVIVLQTSVNLKMSSTSVTESITEGCCT